MTDSRDYMDKAIRHLELIRITNDPDKNKAILTIDKEIANIKRSISIMANYEIAIIQTLKVILESNDEKHKTYNEAFKLLAKEMLKRHGA